MQYPAGVHLRDRRLMAFNVKKNMRQHLLHVSWLLVLASAFPANAVEGNINRGASEPTDLVCLSHENESHAGRSTLERRDAMTREIERYQALVEEALSLRAKAIRFHQKLQAKAAAGEPLTGMDLQLLSEGSAAMLAQREALFNVAFQHECWTGRPPGEDPQEAAIQVTGVAMSLSAALVLYDNYLSAIAPFHHDYELRRQLNRADKGFNRNAGTLDEIARSFASVENRNRMRKAIGWLQQYQSKADAAPLPEYRYIQALIEQSPSLDMLRKAKPANDLIKGLGSLTSFAIDGLFSLKDEGTNFSSLLFGNTVGLVETRRGKLYQKPEIAARIAKALRAGDILVEKTPFRLTDTFIPGHWGHAAVWVGNESELRALGIWDHPLVKPHQQAISKGHGVVEALRSGVEINTLEHFLNIDDLGVLRHEKLSDEKRIDVILLTLRQVGKAYDFNFDAESTNRIFCSKLVYLAYGDLQWPTSRILGRVTVSPDNIASRAFGDGPLQVALLYHDGLEITEGVQGFMRRLLQPATLALDSSASATKPAGDK
jgi:uncharacterized protein YycO